MKQVEIFDGIKCRTSDVQKEKKGGCIVKATISDADGKHGVDRTVYVDANGERCVQIHMGYFATLKFYENKGDKVKVWF